MARMNEAIHRAMLRVFDDRQRELLFMHPPRRVVSLVPSDTQNVVALGAASRLVGRTRYCEDALEVATIGGTKDADVPAILALAPDLILANQEENSRAHLEALARSGIPLLISFPRTVAEGLAHLARLARILEVDARELLRSGYAAIAKQEAQPVRTFVPIWMEPLMTVNAQTFTSDALALAGGENVFGDRERRYPLAADVGRAVATPAGTRDTRYPRVTLDEVVRRAPQLVLLPDEPHPFSEGDAKVFRELLPGAKVVFCNGKDLMWYGARSIPGIPRLRTLIDSQR
jgi:ABC-type Fe3+-hydroxamate transport system substrate-binding protein